MWLWASYFVSLFFITCFTRWWKFKFKWQLVKPPSRVPGLWKESRTGCFHLSKGLTLLPTGRETFMASAISHSRIHWRPSPTERDFSRLITTSPEQSTYPPKGGRLWASSRAHPPPSQNQLQRAGLQSTPQWPEPQTPGEGAMSFWGGRGEGPLHTLPLPQGLTSPPPKKRNFKLSRRIFLLCKNVLKVLKDTEK